MSGDLISRGVLLQVLYDINTLHIDESGETRQLIAIDVNKLIDYVKKMPTAYDLDNVVEKLEVLHDLVNQNQRLAVCQSIEIVKRGGRDE